MKHQVVTFIKDERKIRIKKEYFKECDELDEDYDSEGKDPDPFAYLRPKKDLESKLKS